jgi:hypothetical protein
LSKPSSRKVKSPPYTHRDIGRAIFNSEIIKYSIATWLKVELYSLFFTVLPKLIAFAVWVVIIAAIYWGVTLI